MLPLGNTAEVGLGLEVTDEAAPPPPPLQPQEPELVLLPPLLPLKLKFPPENISGGPMDLDLRCPGGIESGGLAADLTCSAVLEQFLGAGLPETTEPEEVELPLLVGEAEGGEEEARFESGELRSSSRKSGLLSCESA